MREDEWSKERDGGRKDVTGKKISVPNFSKRLKNEIIIGKPKFPTSGLPAHDSREDMVLSTELIMLTVQASSYLK